MGARRPGGLAAVGGAGYGGLRLRRTLKARASARATLATSVGQMAQAWFELDESNELIDARVAALPPVSDQVADDIRAAHAEAVTTRDAATDTYLRMSDVFTDDHDREDRHGRRAACRRRGRRCHPRPA